MSKAVFFSILGLVLICITFFTFTYVSSQMEKFRKMTEELLRQENGQELVKARLKKTVKFTVITMFFFYLCLGAAVAVTMAILAFITKP